MTFDEWWDSGLLTQTNLYPEDSPVFWAWEGWRAAEAATLRKVAKELRTVADEVQLGHLLEIYVRLLADNLEGRHETQDL